MAGQSPLGAAVVRSPGKGAALPPSLHWGIVARNRRRFPLYTALLPTTRAGLLTMDFLLVGLTSLLGSYLLWNRSSDPGRMLLLTAFFCAFYVLGGVRRGQDNYADELARALSLGPVIGVRSADLYISSTLRVATRRFVICAGAVPLALAVTGASDRVRPATVVSVVLMVGLLPTTAMVLREVVAHASVALRRVLLPKYNYLLAGLLVGLGVSAFFTVVGSPGPSTGAGHRSPASTYPLPAAVAAFLVAVALTGALYALARVIARRVASHVRPVGFDRRRRLRLPAWTPLSVRMWASRGRGRSSVIIGFTALVFSLIAQLRKLAGMLPAPAGHPQAYMRPEMGVVLLYAIVYFSAVLFEAPLEMRLIRARLPLLNLVSIPASRESWDLFAGVLAPVGIVAVLAAEASARWNVFPGVSPETVAAIAILVAAGSSSVVASIALNGGALSGGSAGTARSAQTSPMAAYVKASIFVLFPAMLAAGFEATHKVSAAGQAAVSAIPLLLAGVVLWYMKRFIRRQFPPGR